MFEYPHLTGSTEDQLRQLKSYLYQLIDQLNYEFSHTESAGSAATVQQNEYKNNVTE